VSRVTQLRATGCHLPYGIIVLPASERAPP